MKDIELYNAIEKLVTSKKEASQTQYTTHRGFDFFNKQMYKKKLIPVDPQKRMKNTLKQFSKIDTYINAEKLIQEIKNSYYLKQKNSKPVIIETKISNQQNIINGFRHSSTKKAIVAAEQNKAELNLINNVIKRLEKSSFANLSQDQHCKYMLSVLTSPQPLVPQDFDFNFKDIAERAIEQPLPKQKNTKQPLQGKNNIKEYKKHRELIGRIFTYLQIVLENQHHRKWQSESSHLSKTINRKKLYRSTTKELQVEPKKLQAKKKLTFQKKYLSVFHSPDSTTKQRQNLSFRKKIVDDFTFRKRFKKDKILGKTSAFLDALDQQRLEINKQNSIYLDKLKKSIKKTNSAKILPIFYEYLDLDT